MKTVLMVLIGLIPSIIWLWYFRMRDFKPEPRKQILKFLIRGGISAIIALFFQFLLIEYLGIKGVLVYGLPIFSVLLAASIEEISKFLLFRYKLFKVKSFDEPVDSIIYMVSVAMGFAAVENIAVFIQSDYSELLFLFPLRLITATLLHAVAAAILGYFFALYLTRKSKKVKWQRGFYLILGFMQAILLHTIYNTLIHYSDLTNSVSFSLWMIAVLLLFSILTTSHLTVRLNKLK